MYLNIFLCIVLFQDCGVKQAFHCKLTACETINTYLRPFGGLLRIFSHN